MSNLLISPPTEGEYEKFYEGYVVRAIRYSNLLEAFLSVHRQTQEMMKELPEEKHHYRYATGKWTIKEIMVHLMDSERIFAYRALRFARNDQKELPGFDQDWYVAHGDASQRSLADIMEEFDVLRKSTVLLFKSFTPEMLLRKGIANNSIVSVRALGYIILGHELHHIAVFKERYL
ncbi:MAG: DinB family protein [Flammeovirgaceae bacterium]|nr:DinB family protein [Flammeovirgaceae bacterium]MDW8288045.1 DinB family protein [Flammeovirgaceae bacterium]